MTAVMRLVYIHGWFGSSIGSSSSYNLTVDPVSTNATKCSLLNSPQLTLNSGSDLRTVVLSLNLTHLLHPHTPRSSPLPCPTDDSWDEAPSCTVARASVCPNNSLGWPLLLFMWSTNILNENVAENLNKNLISTTFY